MPVFTQRRGLVGASGRVQRFNFNGGTDVNLLTAVDNDTGEPFSAYNKTKKIIVRVQGDCLASSTSNGGLFIPDLSAYFRVELVVDAGFNIYGDGGNGGSGGDPGGGNGAAGGPALVIDSANDPGILFLRNEGAIRGGGGGGGAGRGGSVTRGPTKGCDQETRSGFGGGGGGGRAAIDSIGGGGGTGGDNGNINGAGAGGLGTGESFSCFPGSVTGGNGGSGGDWGSGGGAGGSFSGIPGGSGGAPGSWIQGSAFITIELQGDTSGPTS